MELGTDEKIVLDDGPLGFRTKLTLTNKRLIVQKGSGLRNMTWRQIEEIPLESIEVAYTNSDSFSAMAILTLEMKNGEDWTLRLKLDDIGLLGSFMVADSITGMAMRAKILTDRWVNAINNQLNKNQIEQRMSGVNKCSQCGKELPKGNFMFCPFCGNSLKP